MKPLFVLFDLDGTIINSFAGVSSSVRYALSHFGIEKTDSQLAAFIGPPLEYSFKTFCGLDSRDTAVAVKKYREHYQTKGVLANKVYRGVPTLLKTLKKDGEKIFLATSKPEVFARRILADNRLDKYFAYIGGASLDNSRSEKADVISYIMHTCNISAHEAVMVGDRSYDIVGARRLGMPSIGILWGFGCREEFEIAGADYIAKEPQDVFDIIKNM